MSKRRGTPSLMDDLLGGSKKKTPDSMPTNQYTSKTAVEDETPPGEAKTKATFYINENILYELEAAKLQLRRFAPTINKKELTKSTIVEAALEIVLEELKRNGRNSQLAGYIGTG